MSMGLIPLIDARAALEAAWSSVEDARINDAVDRGVIAANSMELRLAKAEREIEAMRAEYDAQMVVRAKRMTAEALDKEVERGKE